MCGKTRKVSFIFTIFNKMIDNCKQDFLIYSRNGKNKQGQTGSRC